MVQSCPSKWSKWLPLAEYWYNTTLHSAHGKTPFEVLYGHKTRHFGISPDTTVVVPELDTWLQDRFEMTKLIQQQLHRAQNRMKQQADKHRQERVFNVGDWVYLKLQPYVQTTLARRSCQKLSYKYFGPYKILQRVGERAYKLDLPESSKIHSVVHVSLLKKQISPSVPVQDDTALTCLQAAVNSAPQQILDTKLVQVGHAAIPHVLVRWSSVPTTWCTWEHEALLQERFPSSSAWGQAVA
jgi:hypothetical protein